VSRVSGVHLRSFAPGTTLQKLQRWRVVGNVWEIWSARDFNPILPVPEANVLPLVPSAKSTNWVYSRRKYNIIFKL